MMRHMTRRPPEKQPGFSWGRNVSDDEGVVVYRLFRRDIFSRLYVEERRFDFDVPRYMIARSLRTARRCLRDCVDEIDLRAMGIAA